MRSAHESANLSVKLQISCVISPVWSAEYLTSIDNNGIKLTSVCITEKRRLVENWTLQQLLVREEKVCWVLITGRRAS
ncbi:hypothetical protein SRHO_G00067210 [Serrasalmus rhombeus]